LVQVEKRLKNWENADKKQARKREKRRNKWEMETKFLRVGKIE
jgi:hypothetical protein